MIIRNFLIVLTISIMTLSITACFKKEEVDNFKYIKGVEVKLADISSNAEYPARLKPLDEITISSKVSGRVDKIFFDLGMPVKKGDILFSIEKKDIEAGYNQAMAVLNAAISNYTKTANFANNQQLVQLEQGYKQLLFNYNDVKNYYDRVLEEYSNIQLTKLEMDDAQSKLNSAKLQLDTAKQNLDLFKAVGAPEAEKSAAAQVSQAEASFALAKSQLENTDVVSPIDGIISMRTVDVGELVSAGNQVYTIISNNMLIAEANIPNTIASQISKGQSINLQAINLNYPIMGVINAISPNTDTRTQMYTVRILLENKENKLKAGMFTTAVFEYNKKIQIPVVPIETIIANNGIQSVYVVKNNIAKKIDIITGISDEKNIEVLIGINVGDIVVTEGQSFLDNGDKVKVTK